MQKEAENELIQSGVVTAADLSAAKEKGRSNGTSELIALLEGRSAEASESITETLAQHFKIPLLSLNKIAPPVKMMERCSADKARKLHFLPITEQGSQIIVGMVDPLDLNAIDDIRVVFQKSVKPVFISLNDFDRNYYRYFRKGIALPDENSKLMDSQILQKAFLGEDNKNELSDEQRQLIARKLATLIVTKALSNGATSFTIEPQQDVSLVNLMIDGSPYNLFRLSISNHEAMVDAMMQMAKIDPSQHEGVDQFSRCQIKFQGKVYILAYSFRHTPTGDRVITHIINPDLNQLSIDELGLSNKQVDRLKEDMNAPGIIIATGANGSGKSTLLQVMTRHAVDAEKAVYTVEDVVGLKIEGARQFQVKPQGPPKENIIKAIGQKNPDMIIVDEADKASLPAILDTVESGALMLLSITAPDIAEAIAKLLRTGVSRARLAASIKLVMTHKTIRKLCPNCKGSADIHSQTRDRWGIPENASFSAPKGCEQCEQSGYQGTLNLTEFLSVSENIGSMMTEGASGPELVEKARHEGMLTLIEQGFNKALDGITSLEEILATVPYHRPFSVKQQMRMGRVTPLQKTMGSEHQASLTSPFAAETGQTSTTTEAADALDFSDLGTPNIEKPKIIKEEEKPAAPEPATSQAAEPMQQDDDKANILLVDDSPVTLEFTRHVMDISGYFNVDTCDTAKEALEMLQQKQYHLVITDQEMPEQTGQEFIESIRQHPSLNSVGTILLTGNLNEMSALEGGADGYIAKPTDPELLIARAKSISDIYKRLAGPAEPVTAAPIAANADKSASKLPGKVDFTEQDMAKVASFELDVQGSAQADVTPVPSEPVTETEDNDSDFDSLFK